MQVGCGWTSWYSGEQCRHCSSCCIWGISKCPWISKDFGAQYFLCASFSPPIFHILVPFHLWSFLFEFFIFCLCVGAGCRLLGQHLADKVCTWASEAHKRANCGDLFSCCLCPLSQAIFLQCKLLHLLNFLGCYVRNPLLHLRLSFWASQHRIHSTFSIYLDQTLYLWVDWSHCNLDHDGKFELAYWSWSCEAVCIWLDADCHTCTTGS